MKNEMDDKHLMPIQKETKMHKYDPDQKEEEPKYIVTFDPVKDEGDGGVSLSSCSCKGENGVVENLQYKYVEKEPPGRLPDTIEKNDDVKFKIEFKDRKVFTKEELAEQYKSQVDTGGYFWDFFKHIGNSNICHFELVHWHERYQNAYVWQSYRDLGDGWYILLTINKESGIVAAFKIFDKDFDINSDAGTKGEILHLYTGNPKDMHEVEQVIKLNLGKTMHFYDGKFTGFIMGEEFRKGIDLKWKPKGYGEQWGTVIKPKQDIDIIPVENPAPSLYDFIEHGRKMEMDVVNAMGIPIKDSVDYIGALGVDALSKLISSRDSEWLTCIDLIKSGFKGFDQRRRKLAKRRNTVSTFSFYKKYKMASGWDIRMI